MKLNIPRKNWFRGHGSAVSKLLLRGTASREQCCVGLYCTQRGIPDESIYDAAALIGIGLMSLVSALPGFGELMGDARIPEHLRMVLEYIRDDRNGPARHKTLYLYRAEAALYLVNDSMKITDKLREQLLTEIFAVVGIDAVFFDEEINFDVQ